MTAGTDDDRAIRGLWATMSQGWAAGSGTAFAAPFADDVEFISVRGTDEGGRAGVAARHDGLFASTYRGTSLDADVQLIRYLTPDIAVVHVETRILRPDGRRMVTTHAQAVTVRRKGQWHITAFHNMVPFAPAPPDTDRSSA